MGVNYGINVWLSETVDTNGNTRITGLRGVTDPDRAAVRFFSVSSVRFPSAVAWSFDTIGYSETIPVLPHSNYSFNAAMIDGHAANYGKSIFKSGNIDYAKRKVTDGTYYSKMNMEPFIK